MLTPEQEEQRQKSFDLIAKQEAYWSAHPDEAAALWKRLDDDLAAEAVCEHDWRPEEQDTRWQHCSRCGWSRFQPTEADIARVNAQRSVNNGRSR